MNNSLLFTLYFAARLGLFIPQQQIPFIDSIPIEYPDRTNVIQKYTQKVMSDKSGHWFFRFESWWDYRAATYFFLIDIAAVEGPDRAGYLLGRMQGRNPLWSEIFLDGMFQYVWLDELYLYDRDGEEEYPVPVR